MLIHGILQLTDSGGSILIGDIIIYIAMVQEACLLGC